MIPLQIVCRDFPLTPAIRAEVEHHVERLEKLYRRVQRCEVALSAPHRRHRKGRTYHVSLRLQVPGPDLVVNRESERDASHENLYLALHDAFRALDRRLEDHVREMRGYVKAPAATPEAIGHVTEILPDQDFGLIETDDGDEVYFHRNSLKEVTLERLRVGMPVRFRSEIGDKGPQATFVRVENGETARLPRRSA